MGERYTKGIHSKGVALLGMTVDKKTNFVNIVATPPP